MKIKKVFFVAKNDKEENLFQANISSEGIVKFPKHWFLPTHKTVFKGGPWSSSWYTLLSWEKCNNSIFDQSGDFVETGCFPSFWRS